MDEKLVVWLHPGGRGQWQNTQMQINYKCYPSGPALFNIFIDDTAGLSAPSESLQMTPR